jgi:hypothetical protein
MARVLRILPLLATTAPGATGLIRHSESAVVVVAAVMRAGLKPLTSLRPCLCLLSGTYTARLFYRLKASYEFRRPILGGQVG